MWLIYFLFIALFMIWIMLFYHAFLMMGGYIHSLKYGSFRKQLNSEPEDFPTVSILIPAHNEEVVIENIDQIYDSAKLSKG